MYTDFAKAMVDNFISGMLSGIVMIIKASIENGTIFIFIGIAILGSIAKWYRKVTR